MKLLERSLRGFIRVCLCVRVRLDANMCVLVCKVVVMCVRGGLGLLLACLLVSSRDRATLAEVVSRM